MHISADKVGEGGKYAIKIDGEYFGACVPQMVASAIAEWLEEVLEEREDWFRNEISELEGAVEWLEDELNEAHAEVECLEAKIQGLENELEDIVKEGRC